ncbi:uncharacterized protein LOC144087083 [Stigmatopora argus]
MVEAGTKTTGDLRPARNRSDPEPPRWGLGSTRVLFWPRSPGTTFTPSERLVLKWCSPNARGQSGGEFGQSGSRRPIAEASACRGQTRPRPQGSRFSAPAGDRCHSTEQDLAFLFKYRHLFLKNSPRMGHVCRRLVPESKSYSEDNKLTMVCVPAACQTAMLKTFFHAGAFVDEDIIHVEGSVDPVRDTEIIQQKLRLKDRGDELPYYRQDGGDGH